MERTGRRGRQKRCGRYGVYKDDRENLAWAVRAESRAAIEAFADQDINKAVFYPDDERFLIERDLTVRHYEVAAGS